MDVALPDRQRNPQESSPLGVPTGCATQVLVGRGARATERLENIADTHKDSDGGSGLTFRWERPSTAVRLNNGGVLGQGVHLKPCNAAIDTPCDRTSAAASSSAPPAAPARAASGRRRGVCPRWTGARRRRETGCPRWGLEVLAGDATRQGAPRLEGARRAGADGQPRRLHRPGRRLAGAHGRAALAAAVGLGVDGHRPASKSSCSGCLRRTTATSSSETSLRRLPVRGHEGQRGSHGQVAPWARRPPTSCESSSAGDVSPHQRRIYTFRKCYREP